MKKIIYGLFALFIMSATACSEKVSEVKTENKEDKNLFKIEEPGFEMALDIPNEWRQKNEPNAFFDHSVGYLKFRLGEEVAIDIVDEDIQLDEFKSTLENKQLFSFEYSDENSAGFSYQSKLPDGSIYSSNFIQKFTLNDKNFYAKGSPDMEFSEEKITRMKAIISSIESI